MPVTVPKSQSLPKVLGIGHGKRDDLSGNLQNTQNWSERRDSNLIAYLSEERPVIFDERQMAYIVGRIEMKRMRRSLETDEYHLNSVRRRIQARQNGLPS